MSTVRAIAVVISAPHDVNLVLSVLRPDDDKDLPGVWGLPATTVRKGEADPDAALRLGETKLGASLTLRNLLADGTQGRPDYRLYMRLYSASLANPEPALPSSAEQEGVTYYADWRWALMSSLVEGAERGSLCCALALRSAGARAR